MTCDKPKVQLYLYLDGELASSEADEVERHLQTCSVCQHEAAMHHRMQTLLQTAIPQEEVPERLWLSIRRQLTVGPSIFWLSTHWLFRKRFVAGSVTAVALVLMAFMTHVWFSASAPSVVREIVDSQIRSHLMQASYHTINANLGAIRRWFDSQVEFSPPLPAIPEEDYVFLGVRLNYFLDRRVAEMGFESGTHTLSFLMFSDKDVSLKSMRPHTIGNRTFYVDTYKGYSTVLWQDGEVLCSLVSDLDWQKLLHVASTATGVNPAS